MKWLIESFGAFIGAIVVAIIEYARKTPQGTKVIGADKTLRKSIDDAIREKLKQNNDKRNSQ